MGKYVRPQNPRKLNNKEKIALLQEYVAHCEKSVREQGIKALNVKIPREVFAQVLDTLGGLLQEKVNQLLKESKDVQNFLQTNSLPAHIAELLPDDFRVFALLLNALKQWVSAESAATDRFLLGGKARQLCRKVCRETAERCIVTGEKFSDDAQLHHQVRDGRPPILLSKKGHEIVEQEKLTGTQNVLWQKLRSLRSKQHQSWVQLREGCVALLNPGTPCRSGAKSFANTVIRETNSTAGNIIQLLDENVKG